MGSGFIQRLRYLVGLDDLPTFERMVEQVDMMREQWPDLERPYRELKMADLTDVPLRIRIVNVEKTKQGKLTYVCVRALFEGYDSAELFLRIPPAKFKKLMILTHKRGGNAMKNYLKGALHEKYSVNPKQRQLFDV